MTLEGYRVDSCNGCGKAYLAGESPNLTVIYDGENDCIRVLAKDDTVLVYTIYEFPDDLYNNDDDQVLFDWVISNHKEDILECLEALDLQ